MAGIFIGKGMTLRLPQLELTIGTDGATEATPIMVELGLDVWPMWLDIAIDHAVLAMGARDKLKAALQSDALPDEDHKHELLVDECKAGMVSICAAAIALDNFYSCIRDFVPGIDELDVAWARARTARHRRVFESIRRTFRVSNPGAKALRTEIQQIFKFRDWAVHPPADFREPLYNELIDAATEWRFLAFRADNARLGAWHTSAYITQLVAAPRRDNSALVKWCEDRIERSEARSDRAGTLLGD